MRLRADIIKNALLTGAAALGFLCTAQAGVEPASKELGAIWFIGDSITQSNADGDNAGSPRKSLYDRLRKNGYSFSFTGHHNVNLDGLPSSRGAPADDLYAYHSGLSGYLIGEEGGMSGPKKLNGVTSNIENYWESGRLAEVKPNLILIMLGTNDAGYHYDMEKAPARLIALLNKIYALPEIGHPKIFLASIPPNRRNDKDREAVAEFNHAIPGIVEAFSAQGKAVFFVDQFTPIDQAYKTHMRPDNLHPNAAGNDALAQQWFEAIDRAYKQGEISAAFPGEKGDFFGFDTYSLESGKGPITVACPKVVAAGKPWLWRGTFWGGKNTSSTRQVFLVDVELLKQGYYVVGAGGNSLGHPSGSVAMDAAYQLLTKTYGFSTQPTLTGMSREALSIYRWASANPNCVSSLYIDNGVCSLKSWPGGRLVPGSDAKGSGNRGQWESMKQQYGFKSDAEALAYDQNPIDLLEPLAKANVPLLHVCGSKDEAVPYEENDAIVKERYEKLGGTIKVIVDEKGHHPHGLEDPTPVVEFIMQHTKACGH
jgi:hypothetical protein